MKLPTGIAPRRTIAALPAERGIREGRAGNLRLDFNENTLGCSPAVLRAIRRVTPERVAMYPEYESARRRMARFFGVRPEELALTNGADEALRLVFDAFVERGDRVLMAHPTFTMYSIYAALFAARVIGLRYDAAMRFPLAEALSALRRASGAPRLFFLANPNNPTGTLLGAEEIRRLVEAARRTLVVVDEAYFEFCGVTVLPWIRRYPHLVVVRTFSKANGLAGLRLGCLMAGEQTARAFRRAQPPFPVNCLALEAALAAIGDAGYRREYAREVLRARRELENALNRLGVRAFPSGGNFLLADFGPAAGRVLRALERNSILVRDREADFGRPGFLRITVGTRGQMARVVRVLESAL
jgi:histidinol-phosphate aminotransferase